MGRKTSTRRMCHKFLGWANAGVIDPEKLMYKGVHDTRIAGMSVADHRRGFIMQIRFFHGMQPNNVVNYVRKRSTEFDAVLYYKNGTLDVLEC